MPKRRRETDPVHDSIVIVTSDGVRLRCSIAALGRETEPRWMVMDEDGAQYVGPPASADRDADSATRTIEEWWASRSMKQDRAPSDRTPPTDH